VREACGRCEGRDGRAWVGENGGWNFDLEGEPAGKAYTVLSGLVVPRPIALVTTVGAEGRVNAAPFSFFDVFRWSTLGDSRWWWEGKRS
jgi:hypothetical protein